ncbi:hypothetical protein MRBLRC7O_000875 [Agrobacterium radiobacter]|uniref:hypothetical protein n=1 Tax=Agrobacterium radiobacter TaxID=362 RepID=UPI003466EBF3
MQSELTRPIVGIESRTAKEVFDIMCDRFKIAMSAAEPQPAPSVAVKALADAYKAGFDASSQGYNGEVFPEYEADNEWLAQRDSDLSALSAQVQDVARGTQADQIEKDGNVLSETRKGVSNRPEQNVANGWQLVPKEPTEEMKDAAHSEQAKRFSAMKPEETYRAMLAAAPAKQEG